jgi:pimeloyl-ACP methyl ester carboxylesterase
MSGVSPIVLIHGAFQTARTWDLVAPRLREAGANVIVATLTGLENSDDLRETVALDTHIRDVTDLLERDDLSDVTLVGHSYAGMIATGVAEHARERIAHLVYVDALVPEHGQSALDILPEPTRHAFRRLAEEGGGWRMRPSEHLLDLWGLEDGSARAFVQDRLVDFSIRCFSQPLPAPTHAAHTLHRSYIARVKPGYPAKPVFEPFASRARREGWVDHELSTGHDAQAEEPAALSELLLKIAATSVPPAPRAGPGSPQALG